MIFQTTKRDPQATRVDPALAGEPTSQSQGELDRKLRNVTNHLLEFNERFGCTREEFQRMMPQSGGE